MEDGSEAKSSRLLRIARHSTQYDYWTKYYMHTNTSSALTVKVGTQGSKGDRASQQSAKCGRVGFSACTN